MIQMLLRRLLLFAFSIGVLAVPCALARSLSLCHPPPNQNRCVKGVGQYDGSVCQTLEAFQNLNDVELKAHAAEYAGCRDSLKIHDN